MKAGMSLGKVNKFAISWCILHRMAADNVEGGGLPGVIGLTLLLALEKHWGN